VTAGPEVTRLHADSLTLQKCNGNSCSGTEIVVSVIYFLRYFEFAFLTDRRARDAHVTGRLPMATPSV
jgi:hypothetical protein